MEMNPKSIENERQKDLSLNRFYHRVYFKTLGMMNVDHMSVNKCWTDILNGIPLVKAIGDVNFNDSYIIIQNHYKIIVDRYRYTKENATILPFDGGCKYNLASHASIEDIYKYVADVNPKMVITDYSRSGYAKILSKLISQKFPKIKTHFRPPE